MTEVKSEEGYREITVDEESELIKTLRDEVKFLRAVNLELIRKTTASIVTPARQLIKLDDLTPSGDTIIGDYEDARSTLEKHFQDLAEAEYQKKKAKESNLNEEKPVTS